MVSTSSSLIASAVALAACVSRVNAHGYILIPESQFKGSATSSWIVQIDPQWASDDWNGNTNQCVETYKTLAAENNVTNIRPLLDDTTIYGTDCGYTDPDGTAQPIPDTSMATFSRAIQHGPCEIWLDGTMVFHEDDCHSTYGNDDVDVKSVFPVDYPQCETSGCSQMRFYWLAFQGVNDETVWQVYKDCIPLEGGSGTGSTSTTTSSTTVSATSSAETSTSSSADEDLESDTSLSTEAPVSTTEAPVVASSESSASTAGSTTEAPATTTAASSTDTYDSSASTEDDADESPTTDAPTTTTEAPTATTEAPATTTEAPATTEASTTSTTPSPSSKCTARDRKRV